MVAPEFNWHVTMLVERFREAGFVYSHYAESVVVFGVDGGLWCVFDGSEYFGFVSGGAVGEGAGWAAFVFVVERSVGGAADAD